jgi:fatty acid desaturase
MSLPSSTHPPQAAAAGAVQEATRGSDYAALCRIVRSAGLLKRRRAAYALHIGAILAAFAAVWVVVVLLGDSWFQTITAVAMGITFTQVGFLGHDGGHQQVFASRRANDAFGRVMGNVLLGLSYGWWIDKHNRHHANPNKEGHDPDIGDGVLVFTTSQVAGRTGRFARAFTRRQAWLFFPLLTLEGLHLRVASIRSLLPRAERSMRGGRAKTDALLLCLHFAVYFTALLLVMSPAKAAVFIAIHQGVFGLYMGCAFAPNHKGMPTLAPDEELDYLRRQVLTSRNVCGGPFTDLFLGGLNYQIEHHLFPNMPRFSLRHAQRLVRSYCADLHIDYTETSLIGSYVAALRHLSQLGASLTAQPAVTGPPLGTR